MPMRVTFMGQSLTFLILVLMNSLMLRHYFIHLQRALNLERYFLMYFVLFEMTASTKKLGIFTNPLTIGLDAFSDTL